MNIVFTEREILLHTFYAWCTNQGIKFSYDKPSFDDELRCAIKAYSDHVLYELIDYFELDQEDHFDLDESDPGKWEIEKRVVYPRKGGE